jgi:NAD(P)-dependent dehydrogenase (short-subunit alcohol dehydrogenase family)/enamine deaminase RidA (YjgF/YER057c/UK114 family)
VTPRSSRPRAANPGLIAVEADMTNRSALDRLVASYPDVTVLVNNAGVQYSYDLADAATPLALLDAELDTNLVGPLYLTRRLLPQLLRAEQAEIVNMSSLLGLLPKQSAPVYCASKAALHSFTQTLRWQLEGTPVKVFEIIPPLIDTAMTAGRGTGKISPAALADAFWHAYERCAWAGRGCCWRSSAGHRRLPHTRCAPASDEASRRPPVGESSNRSLIMNKQYVNPEALGAAPPTYTQVVTAQGSTTIYVAGQVARDASGTLVGPGDLAAQTQQVFANLSAALETVGATLADLVKTTFYVVDYTPSALSMIAAASQAYMIGAVPPASTLIGVVALAHPDALIEVEAIAVVGVGTSAVPL